MKSSNLWRMFAMAGVLACGAATADYPTRPIQYIVPFTGGSTDVLARTLAACVSQKVGQPVIVVNKPGASGVLAANIVKASQPDGHTLMLGTSVAVTELVTRKDPEFDVRRDMEPITKIVSGLQAVYVNAQLPVNSLPELIAYAKARPGQLNYGTAGISSVNHISTEALSKVAGIRMTHVPYAAGGTGAQMSALMGGEIQVALTAVTSAQAALDSGKIKMIALLTDKREPSRPQVQAVVEVLPEMAPYLGTLWYGLFAPIKTSPEIVQSIHKTTTACLATSEVRASYKKLGFEESQIIGDTPAQFKASLLTDIANLSALVKDRGLEIR